MKAIVLREAPQKLGLAVVNGIVADLLEAADRRQAEFILH